MKFLVSSLLIVLILGACARDLSIKGELSFELCAQERVIEDDQDNESCE